MSKRAKSEAVFQYRLAERRLRQFRAIRDMVEDLGEESGGKTETLSAALVALDAVVADMNDFSAQCLCDAEALGGKIDLVDH